MPAFSFALEDTAEFVRNNPDDFDGIYRKIVHEVPRFLMAVEPARRAAVLEAAPSLTGTRWDALFAGLAEHLAGLHGLEVPAWCDEPERFVDPPWVAVAAVGSRSVVRAPAAFLRHGALPDPMDLDARGGEPEPW
ncbi:MAG: hypothetical protein OXH14_13390 [Alphaproteobacteria bacterium]|nr:hypothetical protein [Alphaproteobacteria bacterium]